MGHIYIGHGQRLFACVSIPCVAMETQWLWKVMTQFQMSSNSMVKSRKEDCGKNQRLDMNLRNLFDNQEKRLVLKGIRFFVILGPGPSPKDICWGWCTTLVNKCTQGLPSLTLVLLPFFPTCLSNQRLYHRFHPVCNNNRWIKLSIKRLLSTVVYTCAEMRKMRKMRKMPQDATKMHKHTVQLNYIWVGQ